MKTKLKLTIELVPSSSWQNNLRGLLKSSMWKEIRDGVIKKYKGHCAVCGKTGKMHAHEVWEYQDGQKIQKLIDIIPLCYMCHMVKHIGFAGLHASKTGGEVEKFIKYFMSINKVDRLTFQKHLKEMQEKYEERSKYEWQLDLENLNKF